jgi:hypothetical protein
MMEERRPNIAEFKTPSCAISSSRRFAPVLISSLETITSAAASCSSSSIGCKTSTFLGTSPSPATFMRRQTLEEELQRLSPPADPDLDRAQELLGDFGKFWHAEPNPAERRKLPHEPV